MIGRRTWVFDGLLWHLAITIRPWDADTICGLEGLSVHASAWPRPLATNERRALCPNCKTLSVVYEPASSAATVSP